MGPKKKKSTLFLLAAVLVLPRIARMIYPYAVIEDDFYMVSAYLMSIGEAPYHDFIHVAFPVLEGFLAVIFKIFGVSIRTTEATTQCFVLLNTLIVFVIGRRLKDDTLGLLAAFLYSCSALLFRYHVFEREVFTSTCVLAGLYIFLFVEGERFLKSLALAAVFSLAFFIKITGVIPLIVILIYFLLRRQFKAFILTTLLFLSLITVATWIAYSIYGYPFIFQVYLWHFLKGSRLLLGRLNHCIKATDFTIFLGGLGFLMLRDGANCGVWRPIKVFFIVFPLFFVFISSTIWPHNLIDMLPFAALLGAALVIDFKSNFMLHGRKMFNRLPDMKRWALALIVIGLFLFIKPWKTKDSLVQDTKRIYGFGDTPRRALHEVGQYIKSNTDSKDYIFSPFPIIAISSQRRTILNYWELIGVAHWTMESIEQKGFLNTRREAAAVSFIKLIRRSMEYTYDVFKEEAAVKDIKMVVKAPDDRQINYLPLKATGQTLLNYCSGEKLFSNEHYEVYRFDKKDPLVPDAK